MLKGGGGDFTFDSRGISYFIVFLHCCWLPPSIHSMLHISRSPFLLIHLDSSSKRYDQLSILCGATYNFIMKFQCAWVEYRPRWFRLVFFVCHSIQNTKLPKKKKRRTSAFYQLNSPSKIFTDSFSWTSVWGQIPLQRKLWSTGDGLFAADKGGIQGKKRRRERYRKR